jgi:hypothetical protein
VITNKTTLTVLAASLIAATVPAYAQKGGGKSSTAQSIMADIQASGQFLIRGAETYAFDANALGGGTAAPVSYYANTAINSTASGQTGFITVGGVSVGYKTTGSGGNPTGAQLAANAVSPGPDASSVVAQATSNAEKDYEVFADGGESSSLGSSSYSLTTEWTGSGLKKVTYTWAFTVAPLAGLTIAPLTGWSVVDSSTGGLAKVNINGIVAGQSVLVKDSVTKYSFSLASTQLDEFGVPVEVSRVQNVKVSASVDTNGDTVADVSFENFPDHTVVSGNDVDADLNPIGDFNYFANAGKFGSGAAFNALAEGDARTILNTDGFAGNNDGGGDGSSLQHAVLNVSQFDLPAGTVTINISGTVKGNTGTTDIGFSVNKQVDVIFRNP